MMANTEVLQYGECCCCLEKGDHRELARLYYLNKRPEIYEILFKDTFDILLKYPENIKLICDCCIVELRQATYFRFMVESSQQTLSDRVNWQRESAEGKPEIKCEPDNQMEEADYYIESSEHAMEEINKDAEEMCIEEEKSDTSTSSPNKLAITLSNLKIPKVLLARSPTVEQLLSHYSYNCQYNPVKKNHLKQELCTLMKEKRFSCEICQYKTARKDRLTTHMYIHTGEKPFSCDKCEFKSAHRGALYTHTRIHTNHTRTLPFFCDLCQYKTFQKQTLTNHIRVHTGEKPYTCDICHYKAARKENLLRHMLTHSGDKLKPFSCNICQYKATRKEHLSRHMSIHTGERPFTCDICQYKTTRKEYIARHLHKRHDF